MNALKASGKTLIKYLGWTAAGAVITAVINEVPHWQLPQYFDVIFGAGLKTLATYIATRIAESKP